MVRLDVWYCILDGVLVEPRTEGQNLQSSSIFDLVPRCYPPRAYM